MKQSPQEKPKGSVATPVEGLLISKVIRHHRALYPDQKTTPMAGQTLILPDHCAKSATSRQGCVKGH